MDASMTSQYVFHLILAGLMGIHSEIVTVGKVSVKAGGSISIPCLYDQSYKNHVKYLCEGRPFWSCSIIVETTTTTTTTTKKNMISGRFSISDDTNQGIFTVTINKLTDEDTQSHYWCAVKIRRSLDVKKELQLSVTSTGVPSLYVDQQEISAFDRGSVTIRCYYKNPSKKKWCKLNGMCVTDGRGSIDGTTVTINASVSNVFSVTMSGLRAESSGWYFCLNGEFEMPVRVTVHELPATTATTIIPHTPIFTETSPTTTQHSSPCTSAKPHTAHPTNSTLNGTLGDSLQEHTSSTKVMIITTTLFLLLLVFLMACFGWRTVMKKCNKTKPEHSDGTVGSQIGSNPDAHYSTIADTQHAAAQQQQRNIPEESLTYSTIVMKDGMQQMTEPVEGSVTYSTVVIKDGVRQMTEPVEGSVIYSTLQIQRM
uniref:uncharacterized protein LOC120820830 isoform X1 n=1 Tax=Gasterosteus aculeatus aculeatus TaxID=481459 RepID=UPI001A99A8D1|nr:uncharacterized protein LOC120820830 isoform X1 [Gasterosteus aculeatus aculeatus]